MCKDKKEDVIEITDEELDLNDYCEKENLVLEDELENKKALLVPSKSEDTYYFSQETVDFAKFCNSVSDCENVGILSRGDIVMRDLHSFDIFLPIIYVVSETAYTILLGLLTSFIYDKLKGRNEKAYVRFSMYIKTNKVKKKIKFEGDSDTFIKAIKKIDINKL